MVMNPITITLLNQELFANMRVPSNIITSQYTSGKEYMYAASQKEYQGYYYELNDKFFVGKEFKVDAAELLKIKSANINTLLTRASTYVYGLLSGVKLSNVKPPSFIYKYEGNIRYFLAKLNTNPLLIKEVNKETFDSFQNDPLYSSVSLFYEGGFNERELNKAETKISGIKAFVNTSYTPPPTEESGLIG